MMEPVKLNILDHGQVVLLDVFGSDARIAESARVSYGKGTKKTSNDKALIRYLLRHKHTSPFEMCEVLFYLKVPIFVARQLVRHRTANINEVSGRYSELPEELYVPDEPQLGPQSVINNQGRAETVASLQTKRAQQEIVRTTGEAFQSYDRLLTINNVSKEISRIVLPLSTYTEMYWKCDLHNFFHFCKLRMDSHAQYEIRVMAQAMFDAVSPFFPLATEAFQDYILKTKTLSRTEQTLLATMLSSVTLPALEQAKALGMSEREHTEFIQWIQILTSGE
jgi:thymidylate synthase (FAD)